MYNFNENFGHRIMQQDNSYLWHRRRGIAAICDGSILLLDRTWTRQFLSMIISNFHHICPICLSTLSNKEIEELKFWLVLRKLKK